MMNKAFSKACNICGGMSELSRQIGMSTAFAWQIKEGKRPVPIKYCHLIENATNGRVSRKKLRSDWRDIWPELAERMNG